MLIKEYLDVHYNKGFPPVDAFHLKMAIKLWAENNNGWKLVKWLIEEANNPNYAYYRDKVVEVLSKIGLETIDELLDWCEANKKINVEGFANIINPVLPKIDGKQITGSELRINVRSILGDIEIGIYDRDYVAPSFVDFKMIVELCPSSRFKYVSELRDCDDFTRIFRGWLSEQGRGNLAIGECLYRGRMKGEIVFAHSVVVCLTDVGFVCAEPQNQNIWNAGEVQPGFPTIDESEIYKVTF
ncbi:hypothetical protein KAR91_83545 [Candidatus Pacearchaeota archaeon]|nr:hypothetical protein [Candidatus Pacearchaeota archaeon]